MAGIGVGVMFDGVAFVLKCQPQSLTSFCFVPFGWHSASQRVRDFVSSSFRGFFDLAMDVFQHRRDDRAAQVFFHQLSCCFCVHIFVLIDVRT